MIPAADKGNLPEWTVSELAGALKRTLEDRFGEIRLRGELGRITRHGSGHIYLDIKDDGACIAGVIWRMAASRLKVRLEQGLEVVVTGRITTFPSQSKYQISIETIEPAGIGALMALLDERRRRLAAEGLFAAERKRRLPVLPSVIGVITSPTGAVIHDILHRLADRFPRQVVLWPVRVQGESCSAEVAAAIMGFNGLGTGGPVPRPEVLIVARGGGSLEDLWGFNEEEVVRAASASTIPIISAIGHETDWTLLDHVADLRAPTPTGAAEMAVPVRADLLTAVERLALRQVEAMRRALAAWTTELRSAARAMPTPDELLATRRQRLDLSGARLGPALLANARGHEARLRRAGEGLARHTPRVELASARARLSGWSGRLIAARAAIVRAERVRVAALRGRVAEMFDRAGRAAREGVGRRDAHLLGLANLLSSLGYRSVLKRGFALARDSDGRTIASAEAVIPGATLELEFADGRRRARAEGVAVGPSRSARKPSPLVQESLFDI